MTGDRHCHLRENFLLRVGPAKGLGPVSVTRHIAASPLELVGRIPKNGGSKPTAKVVGRWVFVFLPKYTGDLLER